MITAKTKIRFSLRTKVLVPVVVVMVLLMTISMWFAYRRVYDQLLIEARAQLMESGREFSYLQEIHSHEMVWRYRNIVSEPKFKAVAAIAEARAAGTPGRTRRPVDTSAQETFRGLIQDLIRDRVADVILLTTITDPPLTAARDSHLSVPELEAACADSINLVLNGSLSSKADLALIDGQLYDITTLPIIVKGEIQGAISFGVPNSLENDFYELTHSEMILRVKDQIIAYKLAKSEIRRPSLQQELAARLPPQTAPDDRQIRPITLFGERYLCLNASLNSVNSQLNYLVLYPIEKSMLALEKTQRLIFLVSLIAIVCGAGAVSLFIRYASAPLQQLRTGAEAIGSGDFTHHVAVKTHDEFGELAQGFNQMTAKLKHSRDELESTLQRLKDTQAQLIQSEKLSGLGEFIAGVAHELNNPLTTVMGFSELLQQDNLSPDHKTSVDLILKSAQRCQRIVQTLLSFARSHQPERTPINVNPLIEASLDILAYQLRTGNIEVTTQLDPALPSTFADSHQLQQVFVNIINNSRQAIEGHQPQGQIKITTQTAGPNIRITIQDTGPGIPEANLTKIFDPFFTTKEVGKGTGLGLSLCYGIIKEHGGNIIPTNLPGGGAAFTIELPTSGEPTPEPPATSASDSSTTDFNPNEGRGKAVLAIDDEEAILEMLQEALVRRGYEVATANNGAAGLRRLREHNYDVILCDWKMPGLTGQQVYEQLRATNPTLAARLIFITGDLVSDKTREFLAAEKKICLAKPFTIAEIRNAISQVLTA